MVSNANVRQLLQMVTPIAYQASGSNNYWAQTRPRNNRSFNHPRQPYQVMNSWRNRQQGNGNQYCNQSTPNENYWVNRQRRYSDPAGRRPQNCQICKKGNHTAAIRATSDTTVGRNPHKVLQLAAINRVCSNMATAIQRMPM